MNTPGRERATPSRPLTYLEAHLAVKAARGKASDYPCAECGDPARDWAYQHEGEPEAFSETGAPYSTDVNAYAPMCRGCHLRLDYAHGTVRGFATFWPTATEEYREKHNAIATENAVKAREGLRAKLADPIEGARIRAAQRAGLSQSQTRRRCSECARESNAGGLARHQQSSGHEGWETL